MKRFAILACLSAVVAAVESGPSSSQRLRVFKLDNSRHSIVLVTKSLRSQHIDESLSCDRCQRIVTRIELPPKSG